MPYGLLCEPVFSMCRQCQRSKASVEGVGVFRQRAIYPLLPRLLLEGSGMDPSLTESLVHTAKPGCCSPTCCTECWVPKMLGQIGSRHCSWHPAGLCTGAALQHSILPQRIAAALRGNAAGLLLLDKLDQGNSRHGRQLHEMKQ